MKQTIYIVIALVAAFIMYEVMSSNSSLKKADKEVGKLQKKIDSIYLNQEFLLSRVYQVESSQLSINLRLYENTQLIEKNNRELLKIKKAYNEKIRNVDTYNHGQLDSFFASRYSGYKKY